MSDVCTDRKKILYIDEKKFQEYAENSSLFLAFFSASWCRPCVDMQKPIEELAGFFPNGLSVGKIDIEKCSNIVSQYNVSSVPTFVLIQRKQEMDRRVGAISFTDLKVWAGSFLD